MRKRRGLLRCGPYLIPCKEASSTPRRLLRANLAPLAAGEEETPAAVVKSELAGAMKEGPEQCLWLRRCCTPAPEGSTSRTIAGLDKKLVKKRAPRRVRSSRPVQTLLDEELVVRLSGKGKKLVRQKAPRRQRRNLEEFQQRGARGVYGINTNDQDGE